MKYLQIICLKILIFSICQNAFCADDGGIQNSDIESKLNFLPSLLNDFVSRSKITTIDLVDSVRLEYGDHHIKIGENRTTYDLIFLRAYGVYNEKSGFKLKIYMIFDDQEIDLHFGTNENNSQREIDLQFLTNENYLNFREWMDFELNHFDERSLEEKNSDENFANVSYFLSELTDKYIKFKIDIKKNDNEIESVGDFESPCVICDGVNEDGLDENVLIEMGCGHVYHVDCILNGIKSYISSENANKMITCQKDECFHKFSAARLAKIISDPNDIIRIQRLFIRSMDNVQFCPKCGEGIAKNNKLLGFNYSCQKCRKDSCFKCGELPHHGFSCEENATAKRSGLFFLREIIANGNSGQYGKCPNCKVTMGKLDGCDQMVCGTNASDKNDIGSYRGRGCGKEFKWSERIRIEDFVKEYDSNLAENNSEKIELSMLREIDNLELRRRPITERETCDETNRRHFSCCRLTRNLAVVAGACTLYAGVCWALPIATGSVVGFYIGKAEGDGTNRGALLGAFFGFCGSFVPQFLVGTGAWLVAIIWSGRHDC